MVTSLSKTKRNQTENNDRRDYLFVQAIHQLTFEIKHFIPQKKFTSKYTRATDVI